MCSNNIHMHQNVHANVYYTFRNAERSRAHRSLNAKDERRHESAANSKTQHNHLRVLFAEARHGLFKTTPMLCSNSSGPNAPVRIDSNAKQ